MEIRIFSAYPVRVINIFTPLKKQVLRLFFSHHLAFPVITPHPNGRICRCIRIYPPFAKG